MIVKKEGEDRNHSGPETWNVHRLAPYRKCLLTLLCGMVGEPGGSASGPLGANPGSATLEGDLRQVIKPICVSVHLL